MATNKTVILVESPNKVATIKSLLRGTKYEGAIVKASVGHICHIADNKQSYKNSGIFPEDSFKIDYKVMQEKKDLVKELKNIRMMLILSIYAQMKIEKVRQFRGF